jgi:anti-sigma-K factor RskA
MDYSRPQRADRLAAEYVLGTLRGPARRRFQTLLPAHPALRQAVAHWEQRLVVLAASEPGEEPPPRVWQRIEQQLFHANPAQTAPRPGLWQGLALWRTLSALAVTAVLALLVLPQPQPAPQPPVVIVLQANPEVAQAAQAALGVQASFVASVSADGRALVLRPLGDLALQPQRALELWAVPPQGAPRSLGLVQASGTTTVLRAQLLQDVAAFAVSVEPAGGSPTGAPTGPIVSVGSI